MNIEIRLSYEDYVKMEDDDKDFLKKNFNWNKEDRLWSSNNLQKSTLDFIIKYKDIIKNYNNIIGIVNKRMDCSIIKSMDLSGYPYLYNFQKNIISGTLKLYETGHKGVNLFLEVGIGKTIISLVTANIINNNINNNIYNKSIIILCPSVLKRQWAEELTNFNFGVDISTIVEGTAKNRKELWKSSNRFKITTYESFRIDYLKGYVNDFNVLVLDECLIVKNPSTNIHKTIQDVSKKVDFILNLTGTPFSNSLKDVFGINYIIDKTTYKNLVHFNSKHAVYNEVWNGREKIIIIGSYKDENVFFDSIKDHTFSLKKKDVKDDLPDITTYYRYFEMTSDQEKLLIHLNSYVGDEESIFKIFMLLKMLDNSPTLLMTSLSDKIFEYENKWEIKDIGEKIERLKVEIEQIGDNQILVFTEFINMSKFIYEELNKIGINCEVISGNTNQKTKDTIIKQFKEGETKVLIATNCLAQGISFPDVDYLINFDLPVTCGEFEQRKGRILRINSKNNKVIINFVGSIIGLRIKSILENKLEFASEIDRIKYILKKDL